MSSSSSDLDDVNPDFGGSSNNRTSGSNAAKGWQKPGKLTRTKTVVATDAPEFEERDAATEAIAKKETLLFCFGALTFQIILIILHAIWTDYLSVHIQEDVEEFYSYFRDVLVMILVGFGFLMTFLRRYGFGAIGYTVLITSLVIQWSIILGFFFTEINDGGDFDSRREISIESLLEALFCTGAVLISFGAFLGKVSPLQLLFLSIIEPFFFWMNFYIGALVLEAVDIGGGIFIHAFGAYFGLGVTWWLSSAKTSGHPDNVSCYTSDLLSLLGTLFLWIMWPSFNAAIAAPGEERLNAIVNTILSLCGASLATFITSRILSESRSKFELAHLQNSSLSGGVAMGVIAHLPITPAGAIGTGFITGAISTVGYIYITPLLNKLRIQDICGVHNLHGIPGVIATIASMIAVAALDDDYDFPHGASQAGYQAAALVITIPLALAAGWGTGAILRIVNPDHLREMDYYNDRPFWDLPSDYGDVI